MESEKTISERAATHAAVSGSPGEGARTAGLARVFWPILLLVLVIGLVLGMAIPYRIESPLLTAGIVLVLALALALMLFWGDRRLRAYFKGAEGEERVARILGFLPSEYFVFHSLWLRGETSNAADDVDHVVVGPSGIFVLETKNWAGEITVEKGTVLLNGRQPHRPPLQQVYQAARQVRDHIHEESGLELKVSPVLCFAGGASISGDSEASGVRICTVKELSQLVLNEEDASLSADKIERVVEVFTKREAS